MSDAPVGNYEKFLFALFILGALTLAMATVLILYDVIARNLGFTPYAHTIALTEYSLYYMTMLGAPWLARKKQHIYIQLLTGLLPTSFRPVLFKTCYFLCAVTCVLLCYYSGLIAVESLVRGGAEVRSFDMPRWILFAVMPVSFLLLTVEFCRYLFGADSMYGGDLGIHE